MSCDIHLYAEVRRDGRWELVEEAELVAVGLRAKAMTKEERQEIYDGYFRSEGPSPTEEAEAGLLSWSSDFDPGANYKAFGVLAGVRWYPCPTVLPGGRKANRGIPEDASEGYKIIAKHWESDGHSHNWLTLSELLNYDWDQPGEWVWDNSDPDFLVALDSWKDQYRPYMERVREVEAVKGSALTREERAALGADEIDTDPPEPPIVLATIRQLMPAYVALFEKMGALGEPADVRVCFLFDN